MLWIQHPPVLMISQMKHTHCEETCLLWISSKIKIENCIIDFKFDLVEFISKLLNIPTLEEVTQKDSKSYYLEYGLSISNTEFKKYVSFSLISYKQPIFLSDVLFEDRVAFIGSHFNYNENGLNLSHCIFKKKCNFEVCRFETKVEFDLLQFENELKFEECSFLHETTLSALFPKNNAAKLLISNVIIDDLLSIGLSFNVNKFLFENLRLSKSGILKIGPINVDYEINHNPFEMKEISKLKSGQLRFSYSLIEGIISLNQVYLNQIDFEDCIVTGNIIENELNYKSLARKEAAILLKNAALKSGDTYIYNKHKSEEFDFLLKELTASWLHQTADKLSGISKKEKINSKLKRIYSSIQFFCIYTFSAFLSKDRFLLWLNKYSNNFGLSWFRGVVFTMTTAMIFYWLINYTGATRQMFIVNWRFDNFGEVWEGYLRILNILSFGNDLENFSLNAWGKTLLLLSRIFIGYGIYQTISAFRKYSNK